PRHDRPGPRGRLRARHGGDGPERPHTRRARGHALLPREAAGRLPAEALSAPTRVGIVAYFCMEFGLHEELQIYAGGLGILARDFLKAARDLGLRVLGVGVSG